MNPQPTRRPTLVWDLPVRIAHWLLVFALAGSWATHYAGPAWFGWHRRCGYLVLLIVAFRLAWGFAGSQSARFAQFVRGPGAIVFWLRAGSPPLAGHNPLGALSVVAMLALLLLQTVTGLFANDEIASAGPFYGWVSHELSNRLSRLHRANENWLLALICLHIGAVAWYVLLRKRPLLRGMIDGFLDTEPVLPEPVRRGSAWRALAIALVLAALLVALLRRAPDSAPVLF